MTESPDVPWAKSQDARGMPKDFQEPPSPAALFFHGFMKSKGASRGAMLDVGCGSGRNAVYFARNGFDVSAVDKSESVMEDLDLYGVQLFCHDVTEFWLFSDSEFDFIMDVLCYCEESDPRRRESYRRELKRVLRPGGYYLLSVPASSRQLVEQEFPDFDIVACEEGTDALNGEPAAMLSFIMKARV